MTQSQASVRRAERSTAHAGLETRVTTEAEIWRELKREEVTSVQVWA